MKLAWICYYNEYSTPVILFAEPKKYVYAEVIPIAYAELEQLDANRERMRQRFNDMDFE